MQRMGSELFTGQAITCGGWMLALNMQWTNLIVDDFELVTIPRAPNWLVGAANIEGNIVPVVDLTMYFVPNAAPLLIDRHTRLLLGGKREDAEGSSANDNVFAILFSGLPIQIQYTREDINEMIVIPERLRELSLGLAQSRNMGGEVRQHFELDTDKLLDYLTLNLM